MTVLNEIEARLGFVPPFFEPAFEEPAILENLWRQTQSAYLDNPLPTLFKEKLAALLGRYCEVPYCLVCHTCTLRPLGMDAPAIVSFMTAPHPSTATVLEAFERFDMDNAVIEPAAMEAASERDLFTLASAVYAGGRLASGARTRLRRRLTRSDYANLIVLIAYNKMCHDWMAAHPEVSYELDQRYLQNIGPLAADSPSIVDLFAVRSPVDAPIDEERVQQIALERDAETTAAVAISEARIVEVVGTLKERVATAMSKATEKEQLANELRRTADFAQELIAIVSHDLRNPLNNVLMGGQLLLHLESSNTKSTDAIRRIMSSARRAERLIHDLLDFSQARAGGGIPVHLRACDLHAVVGTAVDDHQQLTKTHRFVTRHDGDGAGEWDADRLAQVMSNLLANSISHGSADAPVEIATTGGPHHVLIAVKNSNRSGPIPEDLLPVLFDPFKRGVVRAISSTRSVGLGLYIVKEIAVAHRGRVRVVSNESGTTFTVELPRTASHELKT